MINACFDGERSAAIAGAYQYDTGQRLAMYGLPTADELTGEDELLSGEFVTVQAHFGYSGDSQTEGTLAMYDAMRGAWIASIPDQYLTRSEPVHVYVHMYYGSSDTEGERVKTMYEGVFTPSGRPAPGGTVTQEQLEIWAEMLEEVEMRLAAAEAAALSARAAGEETQASGRQTQTAAASAQDAAQAAKDAYDALCVQDGAWRKMRVNTQVLAPHEQASASLMRTEEGMQLTFSIPRGADGEKGEKGDKGPADVTFAFDGATLTITRNQ